MSTLKGNTLLDCDRLKTVKITNLRIGQKIYTCQQANQFQQ